MVTLVRRIIGNFFNNSLLVPILLFCAVYLFVFISLFSPYYNINNSNSNGKIIKRSVENFVKFKSDFTKHNAVALLMMNENGSNDVGREGSRKTSYVQVGSEDMAYPLQVNMVELVAQIKHGRIAMPHPINALPFPYLHKNEYLCADGVPIYVVLVIKSAPSNTDARQTIRETWGNETSWYGVTVKRAFLLGHTENETLSQTIDEESLIYGDIVQRDFVDHYFNNTYKIMTGFHWATTFCRNAEYIYFVDDDYFVSPDNAIDYLLSVSPAMKNRFIAGYVWRSAPPVRSKKYIPNRKWFVSRDEYPWDIYPPYCSAGSFLVSMPVATDITVAMIYTQYLRFDDVFLGIILHKLLLVPIHCGRMHSYTPVYPPSSELRYTIASHGYSNTTMLRSTWLSLQ